MSCEGCRPHLRWLENRTCLVDGCDSRAPGTHPLCRAHAREVPFELYRALRFSPSDDLIRKTLDSLKS